MLAPQSGSDINGQMGMIQDVITQDVDAIILSTHDEGAAAPLVKQAVDKGIAVIIVNSDIANFPTPVHGVVGYSQRNGTHKIGDYLLNKLGGKPANVAVIEGLPGYHSTERCGGFLDAVKDKPGITIKTSIPGGWNVEGGNTAGMDLLQANPDVNVVFAANDYMIMGAAVAAKSLGQKEIVMLLGNDGDTAALEQIDDGTLTATVNTTPFVMGQIALTVTMDALNGKFAGGFVETPTTIVDKDNVLPVLQDAGQALSEAVKDVLAGIRRARSPLGGAGIDAADLECQCPYLLGSFARSSSAFPASSPMTASRCGFMPGRSMACLARTAAASRP